MKIQAQLSRSSETAEGRRWCWRWRRLIQGLASNSEVVSARIHHDVRAPVISDEGLGFLRADELEQPPPISPASTKSSAPHDKGGPLK
jgi:hypothetical protein